MTIKPDAEDFAHVDREYGRPNPNDAVAMERHYRLAQAAKIVRIYGPKSRSNLQSATSEKGT